MEDDPGAGEFKGDPNVEVAGHAEETPAEVRVDWGGELVDGVGGGLFEVQACSFDEVH